MYVEDVKDTSNTPKGCNAMYVEDVEDVEDYLQHLRHALIYTVFDSMVRKLSVSAFQNFFGLKIH